MFNYFGLKNWNKKDIDTMIVSLSDLTSDLAEGLREQFDCPYDLLIKNIYAKAIEAPDGDDIIIDIQEDSISILSTKLYIDDGTTNSKDSSTTFKLTKLDLGKGKELKFIFDSIGSTSTGLGIKVYIEFIRV